MIFSTIYNNVVDQFGDTSAAMIVRIKRYINWCQQDVCSRLNEADFLYDDSVIACYTPYSTGTVYALSTTVTGVGTTFTSAMVGRKIRIGGETDSYVISAFVSTTEVTLESAYRGTYDTLAEATTFEIYQDVYTLSSSAEKIIALTSNENNATLCHLSREEFNSLNPNSTTSGVPTHWTENGRNATTGAMIIQLYPYPSTSAGIDYEFRKASTDLSGDSDVSIIPPKYHNVLYLGSVAQCYDYDQDPSSLTYWTQYENLIEQMTTDLMAGSEDRKNRFKPYGASRRTRGILPPDHFQN
jgi:hypothetical protein